MISKWRLFVVVVGGLLSILLGVFVVGRLWGRLRGLPVVNIEVRDQKVIVSSGLEPPEHQRAFIRAIKASGMPLDAIALLYIGSEQILIVDAENYKFVDANGRKHNVLVLPFELGAKLHSCNITALPTNSLAVQLPGIATNDQQKIVDTLTNIRSPTRKE